MPAGRHRGARLDEAAQSIVRADVSSQFLSGLLMAAPFAENRDARFELDGRSCPSRTST